MIKSYNIRVYGILVHRDKVLIQEEYYAGFTRKLYKFPGGGLELGEGTIGCLKREFREELNLEVTKAIHFYTTDFFVRSVFDPDKQIISIYYKVEVKNIESLRIQSDEIIKLHWIAQEAIAPEVVSFAIDKKVCELLSQECSD